MNPLYVTGYSPEGKPLLGGIFKAKDQCGIPLDFRFDTAREKGMAIDYMELLCDAWLSNCLGFDTIVRELDLLGGSRVDDWKAAGCIWLSSNPDAMQSENPINEFCYAILSLKRNTSQALTELCPKDG